MNGDGDNKISSLNASKGWLKLIMFAWKMRCKCLSVSLLFVSLMCCDKIKPSSWVKTWERRIGWRLLGTRYNRDTRLQTPGTAPLVTQMCHNLAPARAQRGQGPGGQLWCKKLICGMNLGAGLKYDSLHKYCQRSGAENRAGNKPSRKFYNNGEGPPRAFQLHVYIL